MDDFMLAEIHNSIGGVMAVIESEGAATRERLDKIITLLETMIRQQAERTKDQ